MQLLVNFFEQVRPRLEAYEVAKFNFKSAVKRLLRTIAPINSSISPPTDADCKRASKTWAALIRKVYELEPLLCPCCGGTMHVKAFITDTNEVARLLENLKMAPFIQPLPIQAAAPPGPRLVLNPEFQAA